MTRKQLVYVHRASPFLSEFETELLEEYLSENEESFEHMVERLLLREIGAEPIDRPKKYTSENTSFQDYNEMMDDLARMHSG